MLKEIIYREDVRRLRELQLDCATSFGLMRSFGSDGANYIDMWRASVPTDFVCTPIPMVRVTTTPPHLMGDNYDEDALDARFRSYFWVIDRKGFQAAYRLARIIAQQRRTINLSLIRAEAKGARICIDIAAKHGSGS